MDDLAMRLSWALAVAAGLAAAAVWLARRGGLAFGRRLPTPPAMACLETLRLTPQHTLHLVALGADRYLVTCHPAGTQLLATGCAAAANPAAEGARSHAATAS